MPNYRTDPLEWEAVEAAIQRVRDAVQTSAPAKYEHILTDKLAVGTTINNLTKRGFQLAGYSFTGQKRFPAAGLSDAVQIVKPLLERGCGGGRVMFYIYLSDVPVGTRYPQGNYLLCDFSEDGSEFNRSVSWCFSEQENDPVALLALHRRAAVALLGGGNVEPVAEGFQFSFGGRSFRRVFKGGPGMENSRGRANGLRAFISNEEVPDVLNRCAAFGAELAGAGERLVGLDINDGLPVDSTRSVDEIASTYNASLIELPTDYDWVQSTRKLEVVSVSGVQQAVKLEREQVKMVGGFPLLQFIHPRSEEPCVLWVAYQSRKARILVVAPKEVRKADVNELLGIAD